MTLSILKLFTRAQQLDHDFGQPALSPPPLHQYGDVDKPDIPGYYYYGCVKIKPALIPQAEALFQQFGLEQCLLRCQKRWEPFIAVNKGCHCSHTGLEFSLKDLKLLPDEKCDRECVPGSLQGGTCGGKEDAVVNLWVIDTHFETLPVPVWDYGKGSVWLTGAWPYGWDTKMGDWLCWWGSPCNKPEEFELDATGWKRRSLDLKSNPPPTIDAEEPPQAPINAPSTSPGDEGRVQAPAVPVRKGPDYSLGYQVVISPADEATTFVTISTSLSHEVSPTTTTVCKGPDCSPSCGDRCPHLMARAEEAKDLSAITATQPADPASTVWDELCDGLTCPDYLGPLGVHLENPDYPRTKWRPFKNFWQLFYNPKPPAKPLESTLLRHAKIQLDGHDEAQQDEQSAVPPRRTGHPKLKDVQMDARNEAPWWFQPHVHHGHDNPHTIAGHDDFLPSETTSPPSVGPSQHSALPLRPITNAVMELPIQSRAEGWHPLLFSNLGGLPGPIIGHTALPSVTATAQANVERDATGLHAPTPIALSCSHTLPPQNSASSTLIHASTSSVVPSGADHPVAGLLSLVGLLTAFLMR